MLQGRGRSPAARSALASGESMQHAQPASPTRPARSLGPEMRAGHVQWVSLSHYIDHAHIASGRPLHHGHACHIHTYSCSLWSTLLCCLANVCSVGHQLKQPVCTCTAQVQQRPAAATLPAASVPVPQQTAASGTAARPARQPAVCALLTAQSMALARPAVRLCCSDPSRSCCCRLLQAAGMRLEETSSLNVAARHADGTPCSICCGLHEHVSAEQHAICFDDSMAG